MILSFDPGATGCCVVMSNVPEAKYLDTREPYPVGEILRSMYSTYAIELLAVERTFAGPRMGRMSAYEMGLATGTIRGAAAALEIPTVMVNPQSWQKWGCVGLPAGHANRADRMALIVRQAQERWPACTWSTRKVEREAMASALFIAAFAEAQAHGVKA